MPATSKLKPAAKKAGTRTYQAQAVGRFTRDNFGALEPSTMVGIMSSAQRGDLEQLADLFSYVQRTDPHSRSVISTRTNAVAGAEIVVEPGPHRPERASQVRQALRAEDEKSDDQNHEHFRHANTEHSGRNLAISDGSAAGGRFRHGARL